VITALKGINAVTTETFFSNRMGFIFLSILCFYFYAQLCATVAATTACNSSSSGDTDAGNTSMVEKAVLLLKEFDTCVNTYASVAAGNESNQPRERKESVALISAFALFRDQELFDEQ